ncbi:ABC transporter substrate-binding protein, partial [Rhizobium leguminosarum]
LSGSIETGPRGLVQARPLTASTESRHITQNIYLREVTKADEGTYINKEVQTFEKQGDPGLAAVK